MLSSSLPFVFSFFSSLLRFPPLIECPLRFMPRLLPLSLSLLVPMGLCLRLCLDTRPLSLSLSLSASHPHRTIFLAHLVSPLSLSLSLSPILLLSVVHGVRPLSDCLEETGLVVGEEVVEYHLIHRVGQLGILDGDVGADRLRKSQE